MTGQGRREKRQHRTSAKPLDLERAAEGQAEAGRDVELASARRAVTNPSTASAPGLLAAQRRIGNRAVSKLTSQRTSTAVAQLAPTPLGAQKAQLGGEERLTLLDQLISGEANITDYDTGICYDTVAYAMFLRGRIAPDELAQVSGQGWLDVFEFESHNHWDGGDIPAGSAVGFKRVGDYSPGFFHAGLAVGGTVIRAVNGHLLGQGWETADLSAVLSPAPDEGPGDYTYDGQPIEVWWW